MEVTAQIIADHLKGEIVGDPTVKVSSVAKIESGKPGTLCFLANPKYEHFLYSCQASIILINKSFEPKEAVKPTLIKVDNAYEAIASLLDLLNSMKAARKRGRFWNLHYEALSARIGRHTYVGSFAVICKKAKIGRDCQIYPQVYIGEGVKIGNNTVIRPGVKIYPGCEIGDDCIIHSNVVIGSDGFGFAPTAEGVYKKIPQTGIVIIGNNCEIGANTVVDRATMGATVIEDGVKLDNLVQIAHNVVIGANTVIAGQAGVSGSTKLGKNCVVGGQVGIAGHLTIADRSSFAGQAGVMGSIKESGKAYMGSPAFEYRDFIKAYAVFKNSHKK